MNEKKEKKAVEKRCFCPYCDEEIIFSVLPYCQPCGVTLRYCSTCQIAVPRDAEVCPECGGKLEWK
jgi:RNA polymerase subunit RPABC4/transcription elongation factor Spt4